MRNTIEYQSLMIFLTCKMIFRKICIHVFLFYFLGIYLTVTMGMTSLSIILTVFVLQLHHVGPHQRRVPKWLRILCFEIFARIVCLRGSIFPYNSDYRRAGDEMCLTTFMENIDGNNCNGNIPQNTLNIPKEKMLDRERGDGTKEKITNHLRILVAQQDFEEHHQDIVNEWRYVAQVMDRILFWIFLMAAIISSVMILVVEPLKKPPV